MTEEVTFGNRVIVSDPCYEKSYTERDTLSLVLDTKPGVWVVEPIYSDEGDWGTRVRSLIAYHVDARFSSNARKVGMVAVDSGQMSIVDFDAYPENPGDFDEQGGFYDQACHKTLGKSQFGTFANDHGVVSSSGYGDGYYPVYAETVDGKVTSIAVNFLDDDEEEEEDEIDA